ncbi:MAG TPA: carboxypeptidase-like regulatory domain-containing protein [Prolixibacteraceae bacterium]|nr:carboxypeptidase-like regulatory domain-containing protein [Prolixibacteraceae bacterium]
MKHIGFVILMVCTLALKAWAQTDVMTSRVNLHAENLSKKELLDTLGKMLDIHFSYNPVQLNANDTIRANFQGKLFSEILNKTTAGTELEYKVTGRQVVFFNQPKPQKKADTPDFFTVSGLVLDQSEQNPIAYCNVSFEGQAIGTITNMEGRFLLKIPRKLRNDTLAFSSLGFETLYTPVRHFSDTTRTVKLHNISYKIKTVDVFNYNPDFIFKKFEENFEENYEHESAMLTAFYRELTKENDYYTNISEAVVNILKAPYNHHRDDAVKLVKGRKAAYSKPISDIRFTLMGGPYYITKLDVVKNNESFLNAEFREFYSYKFDRVTLISNKPTAVVHFKPVYNLRDILFEGTLYFDTKTWALTRVEFEYTRAGLKEARNALIHKKPRHIKATPRELKYIVQYKQVNDKWYFRSARSMFEIRLKDRKKRERKDFVSSSEIMITKIEKGNIVHFDRKETFRSNEIFTEEIKKYDQSFWENYNVIEPEEDLVKALKNFNKNDLVVRYRN